MANTELLKQRAAAKAAALAKAEAAKAASTSSASTSASASAIKQQAKAKARAKARAERETVKEKEEEERKKYARKTAADIRAEKEALTENDNLAESDSDIAPTATWLSKSKAVEESGVNAGSVAKTILGTLGDVAENAVSGILSMGEQVTDALLTIAPYVAYGQSLQNGAYYNPELEETQKQMFEANKALTSELVKSNNIDEAAQVKNATQTILGVDLDEYSILGEKADALVQSGGQVAMTAGLQAVGVPWFLTTGATAMGAEVENALVNEGATAEEAALSGMISAGAEILTEKLSGGISFGGNTLDDALTERLAANISSRAIRSLAKFGLDVTGEGFEEVASQLISNLGTSIYKEEDLGEILGSEEAMQEYVDSFIGGAILGGFGSAGSAISAKKNGTDYVTELDKREQQVVDAVLKERITEEAEQKGEVTAKREREIYNEILTEMEKGYLSTDSIEQALGGQTYESYKAEKDSEDALRQEYEELGKKEAPTLKDMRRYSQLDEQLADLNETSKSAEYKERLGLEVSELVKGTKLQESYSERARRRETFQADVSRYDEKQQRTVQNAIDSGVLNNTNRSHDMVDLVAKIAADQGVDFDFANNQTLKDSGFALEGVTVNGFVNQTGSITLNTDSQKYLNTVVGHEITRVLEGTELYGALQTAVTEYAKSINDYDGRLNELKQLYSSVEANIEQELVADLVGDYLFHDASFVENLSTEHRNLFQRLFDEIKYLCNLATAGSKEARHLEKVKKQFEEAYRGARSAQEQGMESVDEDIKILDDGTATRYSLSTWTQEAQETIKKNLVKAGFESERVDKWVKDVNGVASIIAADKDRLDFEAADNHTMLKDNQEYIKTLDASTLCAKRLLYQGTFNAVQHRLPDTVLTSDDLIDLLNMMKERRYQTPCGVCYVESRRRFLGSFAQTWLNSYDGVYKPTLAEVTTTDGLENLRKSHPEAYESFTKAMNKKGSANPKVVQLRTEYRNEIMSLTPAEIRKIEAIGGLRVQSYSDFETPHLLDMMQAVMDMSAKGLTSQAYTKVPNFAWVFGDTGIKINLSLIAEGDGFDADGKLAFSSSEGMDFDEAMRLRNAYSENVGTIIVGANDRHILACMADDRIDFIIPFHRSGWGKKELVMMGMDSYKNYSNGQNEHDLATGKIVKNLYPPDYWDYSKTGKENAERYLNLCASLGREPKFSEFLVDNGDGSYSLQPDGSTDGYWKTLIDFKMYDNNGNAAPHQKVQPNFNMEEAKRVLGEYEGGANSLPVADDIVDKFVEKHQEKKATTVQRSLSGETQQIPSGNLNIAGEDVALAPEIAEVNRLKRQYDKLEAPILEALKQGDQELVNSMMPELDAAWENYREAVNAAGMSMVPEGYSETAMEMELDAPIASARTEDAPKEKQKPRIFTRAMTNWADKGFVFENVSYTTKNPQLMADWNYALPGNAEARAQWFMENGTENVKSLDDIRTEIESTGKEQDFYDYMYYRLGQDRMSLKERFGIPNVPVHGEAVTAEISRARADQLERENPMFKFIAQDIYGYNDHLKDMLVDGGLLSQEQADRMSEMYPHYVPISRVTNETEGISPTRLAVGSPVKTATGGSSDMRNLLNVLAERTEQTFKSVAKNKFGTNLMHTLNTVVNQTDTDVDQILEGVDMDSQLGQSDGSNTYSVFENGQRVTFNISEEMAHALTPAGKVLSYRNPVLSKITDIQRGLLTEYNPAFVLTNAVKDVQDVLMNSQHPTRTYLNLVPAYIQQLKKGEWYQEYMANGGGENTYYNADSRSFTQQNPTGVKKALKIAGTPFRGFSQLNNIVERAPRLAEYIASRNMGRSVEESMLDAARVTINFAAGGDFAKMLNRNGFTFFNASIQGAMQQVRNVRDAGSNGVKGVLGLVAKWTAACLPIFVFNHYMWEDDEEYEELSDYVKQNYYVVAKTDEGRFIRIPKGRTLAVMQDAIEQMKNLVTGDDDADLGSFLELLVSNLAPNNPIENNVIAPIIQAATNKTWYGEDLVSEYMQTLPTEEQYDESTDSVSKWIGEKVGISPIKLNYVLDQYSGAVGDIVLPMLTPEAESGDDGIASKFVAPIRDKFTTDAVLNNQNVSDFYDLQDQLEINANSRNATQEDQMKSLYMEDVGDEISALYAEKREIQNSDLKDSEKFSKIREVQEEINSIARSALSDYNDVTINGMYAEVGSKRYDQSESNGQWYEITGDYLKKEQEVTKALNITPAQYWNNKEEYTWQYKNPEKYQWLTDVKGISYDYYANADDDTQHAINWEYQYQEKAAWLETQGMTAKEYVTADDATQSAYSWAYKYPELYTLSKAISTDVVEYRKIWSGMSDVTGVDADGDGKTDSGSRKKNVISYINGLDLEYGEKIVLFKSEYPSDDTYNYDIIDYLNSREDISYSEMETILKKLGFEVDSQGNISW